ncbi:MAG TPA: hypothetical protein VJ957_02015 [Longimicrobiales bacterium]|nr:hypothetical protein [Longimicrobiales bacterium]
MAGKLSPQAQIKLATLRDMEKKVDHVRGLVEQYAVARGKNADLLAIPIKRAFNRLKLDLMGVGLDSLSQLAGSMEMAARGGGSQHKKARILRDGVGTMVFQVSLEQRTTVSEDQRQQEKAAADDTG